MTKAKELIESLRTTSEADLSRENYNKVHAEAKSKGFDLPYDDEMTQVLNELTGLNDMAASAEMIFQWDEKTTLKNLQKKLDVTGGASDYYEILLKIVCRNMLTSQLASLKASVSKLTKLLK